MTPGCLFNRCIVHLPPSLAERPRMAAQRCREGGAEGGPPAGTKYVPGSSGNGKIYSTIGSIYL